MNSTDISIEPVQNNELTGSGRKFLIAGIGASAGGIQALKAFFEKVPADSGIAYVVILHLSPEHDSQLAQILARVSVIPVTQVNEKVLLKPDHVYVISPNHHLVMDEGFLAPFPNQTFEDRRAPVDIFLRTLADSHGARALAVILSGTGPNGSMGLKRIKELGGAVFVQDPKEAEFNEMPHHAIATGLVDAVLPVGEIPAKLLSYNDGVGSVQNLEELALASNEQGQAALEGIFATMHSRTGHDFSEYKQSTLLRRIERRMNVQGITDLPTYDTFLRIRPQETDILLKDLLISVTNFFRDKEAFTVLEREVMPKLFKSKTAGQQVRIWTVACATGEEAYSIAMLCAEQQDKISSPPHVQIFATDISGDAIAQARVGIYTKSDTADLPPERLNRFFDRLGNDYRVRQEIREMVLFANQNFMNNPPFSSLDLISCRNVLIYLNTAVQVKVLETLHFALHPGGYLFLGNSETVERESELFTTISREQRIYQRKASKTRYLSVAQLMKLPQPVFTNGVPAKATAPVDSLTMHDRLRAASLPPSLLVDGRHNILDISPGADRYLRIPSGKPSQNLLTLIREELRFELRAALYQATKQQMPIKVKGLEVRIEAKTEVVNLLVRPVPQLKDIPADQVLIVFEVQNEEDQSRVVTLNSNGTIIRNLEEELIGLNDQLRSSNEQHDYRAEELMASNEELQAMVEELRSATEELEVSREELQSINEELQTVNQELKVKLEELSVSNSNLQNLMNSTSIGTVFLDRNLRVVLFTPAVQDIFSLIQADLGRLLTDFSNSLIGIDLAQDIYSVMDTLQALNREVQTRGKGVYDAYPAISDQQRSHQWSGHHFCEHHRTQASRRSVA